MNEVKNKLLGYLLVLMFIAPYIIIALGTFGIWWMLRHFGILKWMIG